jgi:hypothetical protein
MIEMDDTGIYIENWSKHQNIEGLNKLKKKKEQNRLRQEKYRKKQKLIREGKTGNVMVTLSNGTELELELDPEIEEEIEEDIEEDQVTLVRNLKKFQTSFFKKVLPPDEQPKFDNDSRPYKAAAYLRKLILENNNREPVPDENPKDLEDWAVELDRLNRLGPPGAKNKGYDWKEIGQIMEWCQDDSFWRKNIKSASKFRKQITKLEDSMKNDTTKKSDNRMDQLKELYAEAEEEDKNGNAEVDVL